MILVHGNTHDVVANNLILKISGPHRCHQFSSKCLAETPSLGKQRVEVLQ